MFTESGIKSIGQSTKTVRFQVPQRGVLRLVLKNKVIKMQKLVT